MVLRAVILIGLLPTACFGQLDFEREPINYSETEPVDRVHQLSEEIAAGSVSLQWEQKHGFLKSLLKELDVSEASQTLVFSKTSLQVSQIWPRHPRAIYFNDDVYVGWVQQGEFIEISAADPKLGGTFYSLTQRRSDAPALNRETSRCLQCHASTHTRRIPGHMVRSVFPDQSGQPVYRLGTHITEPASPMTERFGGWYVTGTHGDQRHMGNAWLADPDKSEKLDLEHGANVTDLSEFLNTSPYLTSHSDIVALLVLQHQVHVHNVLTAANHSGHLTARDAVIMDRALERDESYQSDSTRRRYQSAADKVVKALLFSGEIVLTSPIQGTSHFAEEFAAQGPFDELRRSLRQFDLERRLFRYPCSFLIYSDAFNGLPEGVMSEVHQKLASILSGSDSSDEFAYLSPEDRVAISEILQQTGVILRVPESP